MSIIFDTFNSKYSVKLVSKIKFAYITLVFLVEFSDKNESLEQCDTESLNKF